MSKIRLKLNKHITDLLEFTKVMMDLDYFNTDYVLNKISNCIDITPMMSYEMKTIKMTSKKTLIKLNVYTQGEVMLKTMITLKINKNKKGDVSVTTDCSDQILWQLFSQEFLEDEKINSTPDE